jgi:signal transduction histidine kinase
MQRKLSQFKLKALDKGIGLKLNIVGDIPEVKIDVVRIEQVIANLLTNAIRHTPNSGLITVALEIAEGTTNNRIDKPSLIISVSDNGEGIPEEHLEYIFDRFYRVESSRTKNNGETGLGLAIVKQMVEAHNGRVWVQSITGKGSTFFVSLPLD